MGKDFSSNRCSRPWRNSGSLLSALLCCLFSACCVPVHGAQTLPPPCLCIWVVDTVLVSSVCDYLHCPTGEEEGRGHRMYHCVKLFLFPWDTLTAQQRLWPSVMLTEENESVYNSERSTEERSVYPFDMLFGFMKNKWGTLNSMYELLKFTYWA